MGWVGGGRGGEGEGGEWEGRGERISKAGLARGRRGRE